MNYLYPHRDNYAFLASGSVIRSAANSPNFPVKLGLEIFHRCLQFSSKKEDIILYDPCCGAGYLLTSVAIMNTELIHQVVGSDINNAFVEIARKNLSLLTENGRQRRKNELTDLVEFHNKESHVNALKHLREISELISNKEIYFQVEDLDVFFVGTSSLGSLSPDIVITDVPYGDLVAWKGGVGIDQMLTSLEAIVSENTVVAIIHDKYQKVNHPKFQRKEKFKVGKRIVEIVSLIH